MADIQRPSIPPEKLLRAMLLQAFYSIRLAPQGPTVRSLRFAHRMTRPADPCGARDRVYLSIEGSARMELSEPAIVTPRQNLVTARSGQFCQLVYALIIFFGHETCSQA
jgi:hypothetical protein